MARAEVIVFQDEFPSRVVTRTRGRIAAVETGGCGCGVTIERSLAKAAIARPEPGANHLMRVGSRLWIAPSRGERASENLVTAKSKLPQKK